MFSRSTGVGDWPVPIEWETYPEAPWNWAAVHTGAELYNAPGVLYNAPQGEVSLKIWGAFSGSENYTRAFQEFDGVSAGEQFTFSAWAWMHSADQIQAPDTEAYFELSFFDDSYDFYGSTRSAKFTFGSPVDTWRYLETVGTVPLGATKVIASVTFAQCLGQGGGCWTGGAVYFDDAYFGQTGP